MRIAAERYGNLLTQEGRKFDGVSLSYRENGSDDDTTKVNGTED